MAGMDKISGAILDKVEVEARDIIKEAEGKAKEEIANAKKLRVERIEEAKNKLLAEAKAEADRTLARSSIKARQELLAAKASIIDELTDKLKKAISGSSSDEKGLLGLIKEAVAGLNSKKARIYLSPKDMAMTQGVVSSDKELADMIVEMKETECSGGVIAEDMEGTTRIDNTYETRLDILLPKLMPEVSKELFEDI